MNPTALLRSKRITMALAAAALLIAGANIALGQAGRRLPQSRPIPTKSDPTPTPAPTPSASNKAKAQFSLKVVRDIPLNLYMAFNFPERMEEWTVQRLRKSSLLEVTAGDQSNRAEAVRLAKAETETLVVWLQLEEDPLAEAGRAGRHEGAAPVRINFSIFAPITGKRKYSGTVFMNQSVRGIWIENVEAAVCYPTVRGEDRQLLRASFEMAARIMDYLKVPVPPVCP